MDKLGRGSASKRCEAHVPEDPGHLKAVTLPVNVRLFGGKGDGPVQTAASLDKPGLRLLDPLLLWRRREQLRHELIGTVQLLPRNPLLRSVEGQTHLVVTKTAERPPASPIVRR